MSLLFPGDYGCVRLRRNRLFGGIITLLGEMFKMLTAGKNREGIDFG